MSGHGHIHGCSCSCEHEDVDLSSKGNLYSLYSKIDTYKVQCLNETEKDSGRLVFKPWNERQDRTKFVESDVDQELLFNIPFTGSVKLRGMIILGGEDDQHPKVVKLFKNRPNMMFDDAGGTAPDQEFELVHDVDGTVEYELKTTRFNSVSDLSIYIPENFGADKTKVYYIGLRGDFTEFKRQEVPVVTYEARANPADHQRINLLDEVPRHIH